MKWFRMYGEMTDDPKIGTLNDAEFRTWVELLCLACREEKAGVTSATKENVNWLLRRDVTVTVDVLSQRNLIGVTSGGFIKINKWDERQTASDSSKLRMRKLREKKGCDVTKSKSDGAEKRREEKKEEEINKENFKKFFQGFPKQRRGSEAKAFSAWKQAIKRATPEVILNGLDAYIGSDEVSSGFAKGAAAWLNDDRWTCDYSAGHGGKSANQKPRETKSNVVTL